MNELAGAELLPEPGRAEPEGVASPQQSPLGLRDLLAIALVPATVPALVLLLALGIAAGLGAMSPEVRALFEQIAGGALLIVYIKEIFPRLSLSELFRKGRIQLQ